MEKSVDELVELFRELVELTILDEGSPQSFRVRAYENAADEIKIYEGDLSQLSASALTKLDGIGKSTAQKIREYFDEGRITKVDTLREKYPSAFVALSRVPGLGPKTLHLLRDELGVHDLASLKLALDAHQVRELKGMGAKSEEKLLESLQRMGAKQNRRPIDEVKPVAEALVEKIKAQAGVVEALYCGSLRRERDTIADVDIVVASSGEAESIMDAFVSFDDVKIVLGHGKKKSSVVLDNDLQIDLRVVDPSVIGAATLYFTGSKAHNIKLRQRAIDKGWTLNEYALSDAKTGDVIAAESEEAIYQALGLVFIEPNKREDRGEVEAAIR